MVAIITIGLCINMKSKFKKLLNGQEESSYRYEHSKNTENL